MKQGDQFFHDFEVTREIYQGFIQLFKDRNDLHTSRAFAMSMGFKSEVMHGNILNGFLSYFVGECLPVRNVIIHTQEIKYPNPVYLGDRLKFSAEVSEVFESIGACEFHFRFCKENNVCVGQGKIQVGFLPSIS